MAPFADPTVSIPTGRQAVLRGQLLSTRQVHGPLLAPRRLQDVHRRGLRQARQGARLVLEPRQAARAAGRGAGSSRRSNTTATREPTGSRSRQCAGVISVQSNAERMMPLNYFYFSFPVVKDYYLEPIVTI